jgi:hypothetical protein
MTGPDKITESRLRRMAARQGLRLMKSRRRDPDAYDFGGYMLVDLDTNSAVAGSDPLPFSLTIQDVTAYLKSE